MAAERNYGQSFNQNKAAPTFNYVYDSTLNSGSGAWTPATPSTGGGGGSTDMTATNTILVSGAKSEAAASVTSSVNFTGSFGVSAAREVHSVFGYNSGNAAFARVYDGTGTNGTLIGMIAISQQNNFSVDYTPHGCKLTAGIFVAFSTSASSYVATSTGDAVVSIIWK